MNSKTIANGILRALGILVGIFILSYFLYAIQSVISYIIIAGILSLIARPIILILRKKLKFPNTLAVIFTMFLMIGLLTGLVLMFIPLVAEQGKSLSLLEVDKLQENIQEVFHQIITYFSSKGIDVLGELKNIDFLRFDHLQTICSLDNFTYLICSSFKMPAIYISLGFFWCHFMFS